MSGFKDYFLEKYIEKIHPHGYTIIVYNQKDKGGIIVRNEHEIYSPGTTFSENNEILSNNTCCIWIQKVKTPLNERFIFGLSNINIYNGKSNLSEYNELYYHNPTTYDSIEKL